MAGHGAVGNQGDQVRAAFTLKNVIAFAIICITCLLLPGRSAAQPASATTADTVLLGGKILIVDAKDQICEGLAIRGAHVIAFGTDRQMQPYIGKQTKVIRLNGKMAVPGLIESHVHSMGVAREEHDEPYAELSSIAEIQDWVRKRAAQLPAGAWVRVPRNDVTRIKERRHPTPAELDAACTTHPVVFTAVMKNVCNTAGFRALGITPETTSFHGGKIVRDAKGAPILIVGADSYVQKVVGAPKLSHAVMLEELPKVLRGYNQVGITAITERRADLEGYRTYQELEKLGRLPVRATIAINLPHKPAKASKHSSRSSG